jgi:hypothetical protein
MHDATFGSMTLAGTAWERSFDFDFLSARRTVRLSVETDGDAAPEEEQRSAFEHLQSEADQIRDRVEQAVFDYYQGLCPTLRAQYGEWADDHAPVISSLAELEPLVTLRRIVLPCWLDEDCRVLGFEFDCKWEPHSGLGVLLKNEEVAEVGFADVVS